MSFDSPSVSKFFFNHSHSLEHTHLEPEEYDHAHLEPHDENISAIDHFFSETWSSRDRANSFTVRGSNFGDLDYTQMVRVGHSALQSSVWRSDTSVVCLMVEKNIAGTRISAITSGLQVNRIRDPFTFLYSNCFHLQSLW
jgi:hypothetical protein